MKRFLVFTYSMLFVLLLHPSLAIAQEDPVKKCQDGVQLYFDGDIDAAAPLVEEGFLNREDSSFAEPDDLGVCAVVVGIIRHNKGQYADALEAYQVALKTFETSGNRALGGITLNNIGATYERQSRYDEALKTYDQALVIHREVEDQVQEGATLNNIGAVYEKLGQYDDALLNYEKYLSISREVEDRGGEGTAFNNIGVVYAKQGRYAEALANYERALAIRQEVGDQLGEGITFNNIGLIFHRQGRHDKALENYEQALSILREIGARTSEAQTLDNIAGVYYDQGQYDKALESYKGVLLIRREVGNQAGEGQTLNNIGAVFEKKNQYDKALESLRQALTIFRQIGDRFQEGTTLNNIGLVYANQGLFEQAIDNFEQALLISREIGNQLGEGQTLNNLGATFEKQELYDEALENYKQAIHTFDTIRAISGGEIGRSRFIARHISTYHATVNLLYQQQRFEEAFYLTEQSRARAFLDSLVTGQVQLNDNVATDLIRQEQEAFAQRQTIRDALAKAKAENPPDSGLITELESKLSEIEQIYLEAQKGIEDYSTQLGELVPLRTKNIVEVQELQALLNEQTTLISYFVLPERTLVFLVTEEDFQVFLLEISREDLVDQITILRDFGEVNTSHPASAVALYEMLIAPLKDKLSTPHLTIIPHQSLHYLPFAALTDGERYLIDDYVLTTLPSASALPFIQENTGRELSNPLILGNPTTGDFDATASFATERDGLGSLPFAEKEAKAIAALYGVEPLLEREATEGAVREGSGEAGILHLAAHGKYNPVAPLSSLIALAPGQDYDGWLTVGEVYGLDLSQADLVVLSACQTNLGDLSEGDELVGLTRAFIFAGTPTVVASLWSVEDEATALLMERFYTHLRDGMGKAAALRQAQLEVREQYPNPYYWAGFVVSGDGGEVDSMQPTTKKVEEVDVTPTHLPPTAKEATPLPEPVTGEQESQSTEETDLWCWPSFVGGLLVLILLGGGAVAWRRMRRTSRG